MTTSAPGTGLPTASVEVDLENTTGPDAGIVQDTAYVDATAWAAMQADVIAFAKGYGYDVQTYSKAAGSSYSGGYWTDEASVKNWIVMTHNSGDLATSPTDTSSTSSSSVGSSSGVAGVVVAGVVTLAGLFAAIFWPRKR